MKQLRKLKVLILAGVIGLGVPHAPAHAMADDMASMMVRMMLTMMRMWDTFSNMDSAMNMGGTMSMPWMSSGFMPSTGSWPGMSNWSGMNPYNRFNRGTGYGYPGYGNSGYGYPGYGGGRDGPHRPLSPLEGRWRSPAGQTLEVRGDYFRLSLANMPATEGRLIVHGNRLVVYSMATDTSMHYRIEFRDNMLALGDPGGRVMFFQRAPGWGRGW